MLDHKPYGGASSPAILSRHVSFILACLLVVTVLTWNHVQMRQIIKILPKEERQTMLFSATYVNLGAIVIMSSHCSSRRARFSSRANHCLQLIVPSRPANSVYRVGKRPKLKISQGYRFARDHFISTLTTRRSIRRLRVCKYTFLQSLRAFVD